MTVGLPLATKITMKDRKTKEYTYWLMSLVSKCSVAVTYTKLFERLFEEEFVSSIARDANRASDGVSLRDRYAREMGKNANMGDRPCNLLEMMVALSYRCEDSIMLDPTVGENADRWFWLMLANLRLNAMKNEEYDPDYVDYVLYRFAHRQYDADGVGGLFVVKDKTKDMRDLEIWYQMCAYLNELEYQ